MKDQKVYDCFIFFNELEILNIRFEEMYDSVDYFVLVEACETFRGNPKPLYYAENKQHFAKYADKIIHVVIDKPFKTQSTWHREEHQRNQVLAGLKQCNANDLILVSDVDEIVRPSSFPEIARILNDPTTVGFKRLLCNQTCYRYYFNRLDDKSDPWPGTYAVLYKDLKIYSPEYCRRIRQSSRIILPNAGWHFTSMGGHERFLSKLASFSHVECDTPEARDYNNLQRKIQAFPIVPIDSSYPRLIYQNQDAWTKMGFIDTSAAKA